MKILIILSILQSIIINLHNPGDSTIVWEINQPLTFKDYLEVPPKESKFKAISSLSIISEYHFNNDTLIISVTNEFNKKASWMCVNNELLLKHENIHFDISEIYARKIRLEFLKYNNLQMGTENEILFSIDSIYNLYIDSLKIEQLKYDAETDLSKNIKVQKSWNDKVMHKLNNLSMYNATMIIKPLKK